MCDHQPHLDGIAYGPAIVVEPAFSDGYRFQVSYFNTVLACETEGCVQHLYIDLQYETADGCVLLSDLVKKGLATDAQIGLYDQLVSIANTVKANDNYSAGIEAYETLTIDGIDLGRLAPMLTSVAELHM